MAIVQVHGRFLVVLVLLIFYATASVTNKRDNKPNVIFILVDDQDLHLNSLDLMDTLQSELIDKGTFFKKHYGHVQQCCPARVSIWTGKHAHNTNVTGIYNYLPGGGWAQIQRQGWHKNHLGTWMQNAGYDTYYSGKIFNGYGEDTYCEPTCLEGWTKADIALDPTTYYYYNSTFAKYDGSGDGWTKYGPNKRSGYSTDMIAENVANFIDESADSGKPFFAVAAPIAPHGPAKPKDEYKHLYKDLKIPRTPNWNPENRTGVGPMWNLDRLSNSEIDILDDAYRNRQRTLRSVDDLIETIVKKLEDTNTLDNTYIFYSSDNGYHFGNHRLHGGKLMCIEEDINVPFIVRGPDVGQGQTTDIVTGHVDIVPTILNIAGWGANAIFEDTLLDLDGTAISFPLQSDDDIARNQRERGETTHLEFWGPFLMEWGNSHREKAKESPDWLNTYKALRIQSDEYSLMYAVHCQDQQHELYDMSWDQYQMTNLHPDAPSNNGTNAYHMGMDTLLDRPINEVLHRLDAVVLILKTCVSDECRWPWKQLHPDGKVNNLKDALDTQYDRFYANTYEFAKVGWKECYVGYDKKASTPSVLYSIDNEQPTWTNQTVVSMVRSTSGSSRRGAEHWWPVWVLVCMVYLGWEGVFG